MPAAFVSDATGEDEIHVGPVDGSAAAKPITTAADTYKYELLWSPENPCLAQMADQRAPLRFHDLPGLASSQPVGSTIGGTGLGISSSCRAPEAALAYAAFLAEASTQQRFAELHGQPAHVAA